MKAQLISNGWWQADLRVLSALAFLLNVENVYTLVEVALPPKIILYCCDPFTLLYWTKNALITTQMLLSTRPRCWLLLRLRSIGFCSRVGYFWGSRSRKIEINSLSSLLSQCEIVFYMKKIGLIAKAAKENSNKLFMFMRLSREKKPGSCTPFMQLTSRRPGNYIIATNRMFQLLALLY